LRTKCNIGFYIADFQSCVLSVEKAVPGGFVKRGRRSDGREVCSRHGRVVVRQTLPNACPASGCGLRLQPMREKNNSGHPQFAIIL
jgi:hypothetical protein